MSSSPPGARNLRDARHHGADGFGRVGHDVPGRRGMRALPGGAAQRRRSGASEPMRRAGLPAISDQGGTSESTTARDEITLPRPIRTPACTMANAPIQTSSSITIGLMASRGGGSPRRRASASSGCPGESRNCEPPAMRQSLPMVIAFGDHERALVSDAAAVADGERRVVAEPAGEREGDLAVEQHVIADQDHAASLHPVHEDAAAEAPPHPGAVGPEDRFGDADPRHEIPAAADAGIQRVAREGRCHPGSGREMASGPRRTPRANRATGC